MRRVVVFGNSASGKSTLAKYFAASDGLSHFDLDSIAWLPTDPPERMPVHVSAKQVHQFIASHSAWVIEGCYADLIEIAEPYATEMVFLNLSVDECVSNAKKRPWEPHKYASEEMQDANLEMLIGYENIPPELTPVHWLPTKNCLKTSRMLRQWRLRTQIADNNTMHAKPESQCF